jgi:glucose-1-phosphate cytidylyltransferase
MTVRPNASFHFVKRDTDGTVLGVDDVVGANAWINGGFFVFKRAIFDYMREGEELVEEPFARLAAKRELIAHDYDGFWRCVDTFKDLQSLETLCHQGKAPWEAWRKAKAERRSVLVRAPEATATVIRARRKARKEERTAFAALR